MTPAWCGYKERLATGVRGIAVVFLWVFIVCVPVASAQQTSDTIDRTALRVCADPANVPFSNDQGQGFENEIADLLGKELGVPVTYTWFPQAIGFVRNTLRAKRCDIIMGYAQGHELVLNTNHYYRSSYVMVTRKGGVLSGITDLKDERLETVKIGLIAGTPPATIIALYDLMKNVVPYRLMVDRRYESPAEMMIEALEDGTIDLAILWGPIGGYWAQHSLEELVVTPLKRHDVGPRLSFRVTFGVRQGEIEWKRRLNTFIADNQDAINGILWNYGVPLMDEQDNLLVPLPATEYRMQDYNAPVPQQAVGGRKILTAEAYALWQGGETVFVDVYPYQPKPEGLPEDTLWREKKHFNIPRSHWLPNVGYGVIHDDTMAYFKDNLARLTGGAADKKIVIYCRQDCWMSWNAVKRAATFGYGDLYWYDDGTDGWEAAGHPLERAVPVQ